MSRWSRGDTLALLSVIAAVLAIGATLYTAEMRNWFDKRISSASETLDLYYCWMNTLDTIPLVSLRALYIYSFVLGSIIFCFAIYYYIDRVQVLGKLFSVMTCIMLTVSIGLLTIGVLELTKISTICL